MGCRFCVHWVSSDRYGKNHKIEGECRRYPKPETTLSEYRCGEFVCEPDYWAEENGSNLMQSFFEQMHSASDNYKAERTKRIELQKKLKALRIELKVASAKK